MSFTIGPLQLKSYQFPDDAQEGQADFLTWFKDPNETWLRAYGFTMVTLVDEIIAAHQGGTAIHVFVDHSQQVGHVERPVVAKMVAAGVETTVGTSYAGTKYIMHQKGFTTTASDCWEGSVNFSQTGWEQVNSAFSFNNSVWRDHFVASFNTDVAYAWDNEPRMQLMATRPQASVPA